MVHFTKVTYAPEKRDQLFVVTLLTMLKYWNRIKVKLPNLGLSRCFKHELVEVR